MVFGSIMEPPPAARNRQGKAVADLWLAGWGGRPYKGSRLRRRYGSLSTKVRPMYLVTGGAGFIGSNLVAALEQRAMGGIAV